MASVLHTSNQCPSMLLMISADGYSVVRAGSENVVVATGKRTALAVQRSRRKQGNQSETVSH
jgi:hypothetical protein